MHHFVHQQALQLNIYRFILESEYGMVVGAMFLGVVHPSRSGPLCISVPRMQAEIELLCEVKDAAAPTHGENAVFTISSA